MSDGDRPSFWQTLPGILTAIAGVITAVTGLIVGIVQTGLLKPLRTEASITANPSGSSAPGAPTTTNPATPQSEPTAPSAPGNTAGASASTVAPSSSVASLTGPHIDLLASENGGHLVAASGDNWKFTIDGDETYHCCYYPKQYGVYAFKDGKAASFDMFGSFIDAARPDNVHELELAVGNDSPLGEFKPIAKCEFQNVKLFETPYQECKIPAIRAKYIKVTILSTFGSTGDSAYLNEFRLMGVMN
ncbi:MAG TPA: hypothetical protein VHT51_17930 [Micropepsaceae bacterium]|nr:hypothetical protein [Micropepsaceae bacterium]